MRARRPFVLAVVVLALLGLAVAPAAPAADAGAGAGTAQADAAQQSGDACTGTVTEPADNVTVVSVQGARFEGVDGSTKKAARLIAFGPNGTVRWVKPYGEIIWGYDVDPTGDGLFVTGTIRRGGDGDTRVFELDPETGERRWQETFDALDTHDADLVGEDDGTIAVANMRNYDEESGVNRDRLFLYDRESGEVTEEWLFDDHYDPSVGGNYEDDWTHVNDVERVGENRYLLSPRNFDQVVLVNTETDEIELTLGSDGDHDVLRRQHNPDYLGSDDGTPTIIVGDSDNDRIVEYEHAGTEDGEDQWERTWKLGEGQLDWPRDADRLPSGNTLVVDSRNHRVLEVTPDGEVVWEVYTPWLPYDAERIGTGDESSGPTIADQDAAGAVQLSGSAGRHEDVSELEACGEHLSTFPHSTAAEWPPASDGETDGTGDGRDGRDGRPAPLAATPDSLLVGGAVGLLVAVVLAVRYRLQ